MERVEHLVVGAGISGLSFANFVDPASDWRIIEALDEPGGYCRTVRRNGFVWDFSGHFFHFRHPDIEAYLRARMAGQEILTVQKSASILYKNTRIDFPFQKNIHQLPRDEFIECLYDLYFRAPNDSPASFEDMLYARLGRGITEKFLKPYNEKLYACPLAHLDTEAMGRFFPHADIADIIRNMREPDPQSYNSTFVYARGGAVEYVNALLSDLDPLRISLGERLVAVDLERHIATTNQRELEYGHIISTIPLDRFLRMCNVDCESSIYTYNKVLVFNLGYDRKGQDRDHWVYVPDRDISFYRVGFYDNIFNENRMSLYVEIGLPATATVDVDSWLARVTDDLHRTGFTADHQLLDWHSVVLDPAYVHITQASQRDAAEKRQWLEHQGAHSIGRYGRWTYCSIEDNIIEGRQLARGLARSPAC